MSALHITAGPREFVTAPLRRPHRWLLAGFTLVASAAHVPVIAPHLEEAPYMGVLFILLTVACLGFAVAVLVRDSAAVYAAAAVICGLAVVGYIATRIVAFPMLSDDVGNWFEPLGVVSVLVEVGAVATALRALRSARARP